MIISFNRCWYTFNNFFLWHSLRNLSSIQLPKPSLHLLWIPCQQLRLQTWYTYQIALLQYLLLFNLKLDSILLLLGHQCLLRFHSIVIWRWEMVAVALNFRNLYVLINLLIFCLSCASMPAWTCVFDAKCHKCWNNLKSYNTQYSF